MSKNPFELVAGYETPYNWSYSSNGFLSFWFLIIGTSILSSWT
ncbi:hypothetical protein NW739_04170 [Mycoplasmopsis felis]|nr:hypothetical protein [Mycoplasmopsis felis]MCU9939907.1 hypothetical protein [Mycoplasmopsis felis]